MSKFLPVILILLCLSSFAQVQITNEQTGIVHNSFSWRNESTGFTSANANLCGAGGPPFFCQRIDVNRVSLTPPIELIGLTGFGRCVIDNELGATICRATDATTNTNNGFRTVSDSNSGSVSIDNRLFSFVDQGGRGYLEEVDPYTQPFPTLHYRGFASQAWAGEALSFSHINPNVFYGQGFKASGFTGYVGSPAISKTVINRSDPAWLSAGANTDLSTTTALTINQSFLDPSASNCLGGAGGFYYPFLSPSDIYNADPNDRFFSQALRGSQDEAFLMVYYDTTIPGCHWWNTRTMTEGGTWGNVGPVANQQWYLLPIPSAPTIAQTTSGSLITGHQYAVCISLTQNNVGETPCSPNSTITMSGTNHGITVSAPNINPANVLVAATGYNTYACDLTVNPSCMPTLQYNGGATNPLTPPSGFSIACTAQCTGANQYNYEVWLWAITLPTTTVAGGMSPPTAPVIINQTAGTNPTWTITYTPPVGATDIAIQRACTSVSLAYCSTPNNFLFDQVKQVKVCATPPCTVTAALAGGGGDNTRTYEMVTVSNNGSSLPNAVITNILTATVQPPAINTAGIKIHDNRLNPAGTWSMVAVVQSGNYGPLINNTNNPLLHDLVTGVIVAATTSHSDPAHNVAALATGHKVLSYTQGCAQDTLINGIMTDCWPLDDISTNMEAGLRHLNPYFIGTPQDNGAHHLSVQGQAPYPGIQAANYPVVQGVTNFESVTPPTDALVGTVYAAAQVNPGYYPISGVNVGQVNAPNPQYRLCTNWNSATAGDGAGAFNSEVSGNFAPDGLMYAMTSDMGNGSASGLPQLGDVNGNNPPQASGTKSAATMARTDIYICLIQPPVKSVNPPPANGTLARRIANNTSACSASGTPSLGCNAAFTGLSTTNTNTHAQTQVVEVAPGHVSEVSLHNLMYPGWTGQMICEYQPWFYNVTPFNNHPNIGMNENSPFAIEQQLAFMKKVGCDAISIDWYGTDATQSFNLATSNLIAAIIASNPPAYPAFMIMLDKGAINNPSQCPSGASTDTCIETALNTQLDYANANYFQHSWYFKDPTSGKPLIEYFIIKSAWSGVNFGNIYPFVKTHTNSYAGGGIKIVDEFGAFNEAGTDGQYGWMQPPVYVDGSPSTQLCYDSITCGSLYSSAFYSGASSNPSQVAIGLVFKGFDWSNANYNGGVQKIIAEQCGQVFLLSAELAAANGYGLSQQMKLMHVATWNDYGEGHGIEPGIDNCFRVNTPTFSSTTLQWTTSKTDATYASATTISYYNIWRVDSAGFRYLVQSNLNPAAACSTTCSLNLSTATNPPPSGTWSFYVEQVGQSMMLNQMSAAVVKTF